MTEPAFTPLTEEERRELAELLDKATEGPWVGYPGARCIVDLDVPDDEVDEDDPAWGAWLSNRQVLADGVDPDDVRLIVALRNLAPRLLASPEPMTTTDEDGKRWRVVRAELVELDGGTFDVAGEPLYRLGDPDDA